MTSTFIQVSRRRRAWCLAGALLACAAVDAREISPAEYQGLSPVCKAVFAKSGTRAENLRPYAHLVAGSCGIIHTCGGELATLRYQRAMATPTFGADRKAAGKAARLLRHQLKTAGAQFSYEIRCAKPGYPLLPSIHTGRGNALSLQGNHAEAIRDFRRALELDPNYAPARAGMAAAQARAATAAVRR